MTDKHKSRWYRLTPDRLVLLLLVVEGLLWLSERLGWPAWHKGYAVLTAVATVGVALLLMLLWLVAGLLFRCRFQFSIGSLLLLVVAVAVPCSWMAVEVKKARKELAAVEESRKAHWGVGYEWQEIAILFGPRSAQPPEPAWLRNLLGQNFFAEIGPVLVSGVTDADLERLKGLGQPKRLRISSAQINDAGLEHLKGLTRLEVLDLGNTKVSGAGLEHLKGLTKLEELDLDNTEVSDAGLEHLKGLTKLGSLKLRNTKVSDAGLERLTGMTHLRTLDLKRTNVTDAGVRGLKKVLPDCQIDSDY